MFKFISSKKNFQNLVGSDNRPFLNKFSHLNAELEN